MTENSVENKGKVEMIDSNLSFDLQLTFQDVMNNLNCSKQEIARRFKLLIQQKQNSLRKQINQINSNNIKILHQKTLFFQNISNINKIQSEQLSLKDSEISSLKQQISSLKSQLNQIINKLIQQQQKFKNFENHTLQDYKRLEIIQKKYQNLLKEIEEEKNRKNQLQRRVNKLNSNTINWGDRIKYLLQNRQKGLKVQYDQQITKLKDILFFYQNDNKNLKEQLEKEKKISDLIKQNHFYVINSLQKKYGIQKVPQYQNIEVQTFQNSIKRFDVGVQTHVECKQCSKINNLVRHFHNKHVQIQTDEDPRKFADSQSQTVFNFQSKDDEINFIKKVKDMMKISEKQKYHYQLKLNELEKILNNQPSKMEDLKKIIKLQTSLSQKDKIIEQFQNQCATLKGLNNILHTEIQNLKLQTNEEKQVRVDSLEFKKKNNTLRLFTEQYPTFISLRAPDDQTFGKTLTLENNFSRTGDMNTTLFNFKTKRSRTSVFTPEKRTKTSKQKTSQSFICPDQESSHWKNIEKKLKNPELFSQSPHVNAARREKYRKFSLMKKKKTYQQQPCINFTIAF